MSGAGTGSETDTGLARRWVPRSFRASIVASTVGLMTVAMVLVVLGTQLVLERAAERDVAQVLRDRSEAVVEVIEQASTRRLTVPADALSPGMVVYDATGEQVAGSVAPEVRASAERVATTDRVRSLRGAGDDDRLLATPFTTASGGSGVLVVSQDAAPYERSERYALLSALVLAVLVVAATALMALRVTRQALRPVAVMAERAADWSEHDLGHRFALGDPTPAPTNELVALGATLDGLLDRVASAIRSEQRLTSELAHELRTPLTGIQGTADLALLRGVEDPVVREDLRQISASAREMGAVITALLDLAREGSTSGRERCTVADVAPALVAAAAGRLEVVDRTGASSATVAAPAALVVRAVAPLVDNACRHGRTRVVLEAVDLPDRVELRVRDDGDGVDPDLASTLFDPGTSHRDGGAGLGLGIARRVARSLGGEVDLEVDLDARPAGASPEAGATFVVTLPRR